MANETSETPEVLEFGAPRYRAKTRARLDPTELALEIGPLTVPPPPSEEQLPAG